MTLNGPRGERLHERTFEWAPAGPVQRICDTRVGTRTFTLDRSGRPLATEGLGRSEHFAYGCHGTPLPTSACWTVGAGGRPTTCGSTSLTWDTLGRLVARTSADATRSWRYAYDERDRLTSVTRGDGLSFRYAYDPLGRRLVAHGSDGTTTRFGWDGNAPVDEWRNDGTSVQRVFDGASPLLEAHDGRRWRTIATDAAGTPWLWVDEACRASQLELTTWGQIALVSGDVGAQRFAGQRADSETGLHYNRHRYYDPELHVFLTSDPLGLTGGTRDVGFVPNPTLYLDPLGLTTIVVGSKDDPMPTFAAHDVQVALREDPTNVHVITSDELDHASSDLLANEDHVIIDTHGNPGGLEWESHELQDAHGIPGGLDWDGRRVADAHGIPGGLDWNGQLIDGHQLADKLKAAGFKGGPKRRIDLHTCNGATPSTRQNYFNMPPGPGTAQDVADATGSPVGGARAPAKPYPLYGVHPTPTLTDLANSNTDVYGDVPEGEPDPNYAPPGSIYGGLEADGTFDYRVWHGDYVTVWPKQ
jgi:RHS repeat-associated protein